jgi:hypothetical protein
MRFSPKQEFLALSVRLARHKRDLLAKRYRRYLSNGNERAIELVGKLDDNVQTQLRQFKSSLFKSLVPKEAFINTSE